MRPRPTPSRHTHTEIYLHTCTHALLHTRPPRAEPSGQLQPSGAAQGKRGGGGWVGGNSGGGAEVHRGREAARWRGGCRLGAGRSVPVQPGVQACLSRPPTRLSFLLPHLFSLSLSAFPSPSLSPTLSMCLYAD